MKKILILISVLLLTGCWNYKELNEIAIATGIAIDYKDDKYEITTLISNVQKQEGNSKEGEAQVSAYSGKGKTITEALKEIDEKIPKKLYLKHTGVLVISEAVSKKGVMEILDYLVRDPNSPSRFFILLSRDKDAKTVLKILSPLESFPSENIALMLKTTAELQGTAIDIPYSDFLKAFLEKGKNPIMTSITVIGDEEKGKSDKNTKESEPLAYPQISTTAIFKDDKLVDYVNQSESLGINIINDDINKLNIQIPCEENYIVISLSKLKTKTDISKNYNVNIEIEGSGYISEANCNIDLNSQKNIEKIETEAEQKIKKMVNQTLKTVQGHKSDVFGFGNQYYKHYSNEWEKISEKWDDEIFPSLDFNIKTNIVLKTKGAASKTVKEVHESNERK